MARALTVANIYNTKRVMMEFTGQWEKAFGKPEMGSSWLIYGQSGSGKTTFTMMLCKYLTNFGKVVYDALEEGNSLTLQRVLELVKMEEVGSKIIFLPKEPIEELTTRLSAHKSPSIVVIDSIQYADITYKQYKTLRELFPKKTFIMISHADGKHPEGRVAKKIKFDADVKIYTEGYQAKAISRFGGTGSFTIWEEGATNYWGKI